MDTIEQILNDRGKRYGIFKTHARITQRLKDVIWDELEEKGNHELTASHLEAIDMIFHKIGRIINGDPNYIDSWVDIAGYAQLVVDELNDDAKF